ncbi:hypothetical protein ACGFYT_29905 [Streptomyces sp. NPDC048208]|uniref:hypothetical protein n=1 Tax=Streptomyces sp. NPDC048208 TaxID=3365515 RepID=UPI0037111B76
MIQLTDTDRETYTVVGDLPRSWEERAYRAKASAVNYWVNVGVHKMVFENVADAYLFFTAEDGEDVSLYRAIGGGWGEMIA